MDVSQQPEVGEEAYDAGAKLLTDFFHKQVREFLVDDLQPLGKQIIEACQRVVVGACGDAQVSDRATAATARIRKKHSCLFGSRVGLSLGRLVFGPHDSLSR